MAAGDRMTTMAIGEEGDPDPWPGEVTTMALGEEGGEPWDILM